MGPKLTDHLPLGATPLSDEEQDGLIPSIQTRAELNELEAANIDRATSWSFRQRARALKEQITTVDGLLRLHRRMFSDVWRWAGKARLTDKNIGAPKEQIRERMKALCDDVAYQVAHATYEPDELAVRFHHRLVSIHPFANGNGRHSRLAADMLIRALGGEPFQWGGNSLVNPGPQRSLYIEALHRADDGDLKSLLRFARSDSEAKS